MAVSEIRVTQRIVAAQYDGTNAEDIASWIGGTLTGVGGDGIATITVSESEYVVSPSDYVVAVDYYATGLSMYGTYPAASFAQIFTPLD